MSNDYFKAQGWFKDYARNSQDSRGMFQRLVEEDRLASAETDRIRDMINKKYGPGSMKYGSEISQPPARPDVIQMDAINSFMKRNPAAEGGRMGFNEGLSAKEKKALTITYPKDATKDLDFKKIPTDKSIKQALIDKGKVENITEETLNKFRKIIDGIEIKENKILGENVKNLPQDVTVEKLSKLKNLPEGYKRPAITKVIFKMILEERGIKTYDNYRTEKIAKVLTDHLDKNKGNILSIKPSAASELLPEFKVKTGKTALGSSQGGEGNSILKTYRNFISGGKRIGERASFELPETIGGKPRNEIVTELDQNFLDIPGARARGNFTVFEETKLLDQLANENPKVKALDLKRLYEEAGGTNFKQRLLGLVPAKTGSGYTKESVRKGGINILEKVQEGVISNSLPESLKASFKTYASGFNQARFLAEADKFRKSNPELAYRFVNAANIVAGKARRLGLSGAGEHALPVSAIKTANAPVETLLQIDAYVDPQINNWKAKNFDEAIFSSNNGLAVQYKKATGEKKLAIQKEIMERFEFIKAKAPELMKNVKLDFTDGKFTASSTTAAIDTLDEAGLKKLGTRGEEIKNFFIKEMPDALTIDSKSGRITNINDSFINRKIEAYITDRTGKVKQPMLPSGLAGVGEMISDDLKALTNSEAFKTWKAKIANPALKSAMVAAKLPTKVFGGLDFVFGYLDYSNNRQKGFSKADSTRHMVDAILFGATSLGKKGDIAGVRKIANKNGMSNEVFDNLMALNLNQKKMMDTIDKSKAKFNESMDIIESGASDPNAEKMLIQKLKKDTNTILAETMRKIVDDSRSLNTNLQVKEAGAPIDINVDTLKAYGDLGSASRKFVQNRIDASDLEKIASQKDTTKGGIGDEVMSGLKGVLSQGKFAYDLLNPFSSLPKWDDWKPKDLKYKEQMAKLKKEDPTMYYKMLMSEGVDPRINLNIPVHLEWEQKNPEFGTQYSDSLTQNKAEGGIIGLRSKYEYKK